MINPTVPAEFKNVHVAPIRIGSRCVMLPDAAMPGGVTVGEPCLVRFGSRARTIHTGTPDNCVGDRSRELLARVRERLDSRISS